MKRVLFGFLIAALVGSVLPAQTANLPTGSPLMSFSSAPFGNCPCRYQQIFLGRDINKAVGGPVTFKSISFKPYSAAITSGAHKLDMEIRMGVTTKTPSTLSSAFDTNGSTMVVVKRASLTIPPIPASGFVVTFPFTTPFQYNGTSNLIFEVRIWNNDNGNKPFYYDIDRVVKNTNTSHVVSSASATASVGVLNQYTGLYTQFGFSAATFTPYGSGCKGEGSFVPNISNTGLPKLGMGFQIHLYKATGNRNAWLLMGKDQAKWGTFSLPFDLSPLGATGCSLLTDIITVTPTMTSGGLAGTGHATTVMVIPAVTALIGAKLYYQWGVYAPGANLLNIAFSDGAEARIDS